METVQFKFALGVTLQDKVTGFKGICIGRLQYLNGCIQYGIKPKAGAKENEEMKVPESHFFDEGQLEQVDAGIVVERKEVATGGENMDHPKQMNLL